MRHLTHKELNTVSGGTPVCHWNAEGLTCTLTAYMPVGLLGYATGALTTILLATRPEKHLLSACAFATKVSTGGAVGLMLAISAYAISKGQSNPFFSFTKNTP